MLTLPASVRIYVAAEAMDLRRGFDALAAATRSVASRQVSPPPHDLRRSHDSVGSTGSRPMNAIRSG